jgi:queuine tRNA-ribosyltransferase
MFEFHLDGQDGAARAGTLTLPHGEVRTPAFMPVGTNGSVRAVSPYDLCAVGSEMILANTYHLHLRPGEAEVEALGGLHGFMAWDRPILTDSGGFQVFSLESMRRISEDGVEFKSHIDGSRLFLSPEKVMEVEWRLAPDIAMAFDHVVPSNSDRDVVADATSRTTRWLRRCREHHDRLREGDPGRQALWPIVQGATFPDLREKSLTEILEVGDWTGIAVGGLAVGESKVEMYRTVEVLQPSLPAELPRYLMGVGFPEDLLNCISRGIDMFDCVAPTRNGRNGQAYTPNGTVNIKNAAHRGTEDPLDETCDCETCTTYSRGYLRHLYVADELLILRLLSLHNIRFLTQLCQTARKQIQEGNFKSWSQDWLARYDKGKQ